MSAADDLTELVERAAAAERAILASKFAVALAQQPKIRRTLLREIADFNANAEARAYANEAARANTRNTSDATPAAPS